MNHNVFVRVSQYVDRWGASLWDVSYSFPNGRSLSRREFRDVDAACAYLAESVAWHETTGNRKVFA